jgi:hypothetical protein
MVIAAVTSCVATSFTWPGLQFYTVDPERKTSILDFSGFELCKRWIPGHLLTELMLKPSW